MPLHPRVFIGAGILFAGKKSLGGGKVCGKTSHL
jgi:hypothetical protein